MSLFSELRRRNVFRVAIAYLGAAWLLTEVAGTLFPAFGVPDWGLRFLILVLALGFIPALTLSWIYELTPDGVRRESEVTRDSSFSHVSAKRLDVFTIAVVVAAVGFILADRLWLSSGIETRSAPVTEASSKEKKSQTAESAGMRHPSNSIAVLPFVNMSDDEANEFFSEGVSEELLNLLSAIPELRVIARTSSFAFKDKGATIADIANELNVAYVLEGSVRKSGNNLRITAQLIRSADSTHVWSSSWDRTLDDIFAIQNEIATAVVGELRITLIGEPVPRSTATNPEAYALYLQGRYLNDRLTQEAYQEAETLLKKAIAIDAEFAPAWRQLGITYRGREGLTLPTEEARKLARDAFERALALDPGFAPAYASLSLLARNNFDYSAAYEYLQKALQLEDNSGFPYAAAASLSRTFGRFDESIDLARKSIIYDPVDSEAYANLGYSCYYANRLNEAADAFSRSISLNPENFRSHVYLGRVLIAQEKAGEALSVIQKASWAPYRLSGLAMAYHALGDTAASNKALAELAENWDESMAFQIAEVYAFKGDHNAAFRWLDRALADRDAGLNVLLGNPVFEGLTPDARYHSLVDNLGLTRYFQAAQQKH